MTIQLIKSLSNSVYFIRLHIVLVTKYRRPVLTSEIRDYLKAAFTDNLKNWRCRLIEFGGEADHVHLLVEIHPALNISVLINNLKAASSRRIRARYAHQINQFYDKPVLWHRAYFVASSGHVTPDIIHRYVEQQCTKPKKHRLKKS